MTPKYRTGTKVYRTIYRDDVLIGMMDTRELAEKAVHALNHFPETLQTLKNLVAIIKQEPAMNNQKYDEIGRMTMNVINRSEIDLQHDS